MTMAKYSREQIKKLKTISVSAKCSDCFFLRGKTQDGEHIEYDGYVPHGLNIGSGDYIEFTLDLETGKILNWKPVNADTLEQTFENLI
jgi:hypothetical protein